MAPLTYESIRSEGDGAVFPRDVLYGMEDALVFFAAGFYGRQDAFWIAEAGMRATCIDIRCENLNAMKDVYPSDWEFICRDVWQARYEYPMVDVVTVDCGSQDFERVAAYADRFCALARHFAILGTGENSMLVAPPGFELNRLIKRSDYAGGTYWAVLERTS